LNRSSVNWPKVPVPSSFELTRSPKKKTPMLSMRLQTGVGGAHEHPSESLPQHSNRTMHLTALHFINHGADKKAQSWSILVPCHNLAGTARVWLQLQ
jgi:hypothetical protein